MISLKASVGNGGRNRPVDVLLVQHLLNSTDAGGVAVTGEVGDADVAAIRSFQSSSVGMSSPDGRVDPDGRTLRRLSTVVPTVDIENELRRALGLAGVVNAVGPTNIDQFIALYQRQYEDLAPAARTGLIQLLGFLNDDPDVPDVRHRAYLLATVKHECAGRWQPIEEYKRGARHDYARPVEVTDELGNVFTNSYYGRGYVQLTWKANYEKLGRALGLGQRLLLEPKLALDPTTSYRILSHGMRSGTFTGKKLDDYIQGPRCDYKNARRIVNGIDAQVTIADHALCLEMLLRLCSSIQ